MCTSLSSCLTLSLQESKEIDSTSLSYAQSNVSKNGLQDRIHVVQASSGAGSKIFGPLFDPPSPSSLSSVVSLQPQFDFTMCNPPFYSSHSEILQSHLAKEESPLQACSGSTNEMIYPAEQEQGEGEDGGVSRACKKEGGEVGFVARMVEESVWLGSTGCRCVPLPFAFDFCRWMVDGRADGTPRCWVNSLPCLDLSVS